MNGTLSAIFIEMNVSNCNGILFKINILHNCLDAKINTKAIQICL